MLEINLINAIIKAEQMFLLKSPYKSNKFLKSIEKS